LADASETPEKPFFALCRAPVSSTDTQGDVSNPVRSTSRKPPCFSVNSRWVSRSEIDTPTECEEYLLNHPEMRFRHLIMAGLRELGVDINSEDLVAERQNVLDSARREQD
jgi:hypothetical protein